ncbi:endoribonuclease [Lithospermum erythrorhizon]|uniref:Endoribonuclease n=1 Tax=Lithospermum erythrorhizon TaxID=34254 RepID=A0AAV3RQL8_LITER
MAFQSSFLISLLLIQFVPFLCIAQDFDFFYFVLQWPGSYCDTSQSCCFPTTGKPAADFGIHGLWPNNNDGSYPSNCDANNPYDQSKVSDLISKNGQRWVVRHSYFASALSLKNQLNILQVLGNAGIRPDGKSYSLSSIKTAIQNGIGYGPWIQCNTDTSGNSQFYQIYICVDTSASKLIQCPVFPNGKCASNIQFPTF